jgi:hypothetical protein
MLVFIGSRLLVLSLLIYIHLGPIAVMKALPVSSPQYAPLSRHVDILVILWEFIFLIGLNLLFSLVSYATLVWKRMTERAGSADYPFFFLINVLLYFFAFIALCVQFVVDVKTLTWMNVAYLIYGVYSLAGAIFLIYAVNRVQYLIQSNSNGAMITLKRKLNNIQLQGWPAGLCFAFRGFIIIVDTFAYPFIPLGQAQNIWNILFKYIFWVAPEFLIIVFLIWAYSDTDAFITELAVISIEYEQGRHSRIDELQSQELGRPLQQQPDEEGRHTQVELQAMGKPKQGESVSVKIGEVDDEGNANEPMIQK